MAQRTERWLALAGLKPAWEPVPFKRSLQDLERNAEPLCVLGVFRTPERERLMRFSRPILQEQQQVFIATSAVAARLRQHRTARAALLDPALKLLLFDGVSYGVELDRWIAERTQAPVRASAGTARVLAMLERGHADLMIGIPSELEGLLSQRGADEHRFETVLLPGMPPPPTRHLACSLKVPAEWLDRLDEVIQRHPTPSSLQP